MAKYRVTTEGGTYEVTTDEPESPETQHVQAHPLKGQNFGDWLSEELLSPIVSSATALGRGLQGLGHPEQRPLTQSAQDVLQGGMGITTPFAMGGLGGREAPPPGAAPAAGAPSALRTALKSAATDPAVAADLVGLVSPRLAHGIRVAQRVSKAAQAFKNATEEAAAPPEASPPVAKTPGQDLAESQGQTWESLGPEDKLFMEAIARGRQNAATQAAGAPPPTPTQSAQPSAQPAPAAPSAPGKTIDELFNEELAAKRAAKVQPIRPETQPAAPTPEPAPETPVNTAADVAIAKNATAKADRIIGAIRKFGEEYSSAHPEQPFTTDNIAGYNQSQQAKLVGLLKQHGYLNNTEKFPDLSWPYIVTKLRQAEYATR